MTRRSGGGGGGSGQRSQGSQSDGWPVEWTCGATAVLVFVGLSQIERFMPSLFVGQCTTLTGMCTPAQCSCAQPLRRRELITQDAQACFQCVADFCPVVAEGDPECTTSACECEDPTWPRIDIQQNGQTCSQCLRPTLDMTVRSGPDGTCLGFVGVASSSVALDTAHSLRQADVGSATAASAGTAGAIASRRLVETTNKSECVALRFTGARITEKLRNTSCLAWHSFGEYWGLTECNPDELRMHFQLLPPTHTSSTAAAASTSAPASSWADLYCSGKNASEFCVEVVDSLCTEDDGRCSTEPCRCENPSWLRQELQTLKGSPCFSCVPPPTFCSARADSCTPGQCECSDSSHVKVLVSDAEAVAAAVQRGEDVNGDSPVSQCYRCQLPRSRNSEALGVATFVLFVIIGIAGGCVVRRWRDSATGAPLNGALGGKSLKAGRSIGAASVEDAPRPWSERWAEDLEDILEGIYELLVENPAALLRWFRPHLRSVGRLLGRGLDACDLALEPCYCAIDYAQASVWEWVVIQHERLVAAVGWVSDRCVDGVDFLSGIWRTDSSGDVVFSESSKGKAAHRRHRRESNSAIVVADCLAEEEEISKVGPRAPKESPKSQTVKPKKASTAARVRSDGGLDNTAKAAAQQHTHATESAFSSPEAIATSAEAEADVEDTEAPAEAFEWDPLNLAGNSSGCTDMASQVAVPEEWMRRLIGAHRGMHCSLPGVAAAVAGSASSATAQTRPAATSAQARVQRKLQQRREALAQRGAAAAAVPAAAVVEVAPLDDSWIDELEQQEQQKAAKAKASKSGRRRQAASSGKALEASHVSDQNVNAVETVPEAASEDAVAADHCAVVAGDCAEQPLESTVALQEEAAEDASEDHAVYVVPSSTCADANADCSSVELAQQQRDHGVSADAPLNGLFDVDKLLSEVTHGLFLLSGSCGDVVTSFGDRSVACEAAVGEPAPPFASRQHATGTAMGSARRKQAEPRQRQQQEQRQQQIQQQQKQEQQPREAAPKTKQKMDIQDKSKASKGTQKDKNKPLVAPQLNTTIAAAEAETDSPRKDAIDDRPPVRDEADCDHSLDLGKKENGFDTRRARRSSGGAGKKGAQASPRDNQIPMEQPEPNAALSNAVVAPATAPAQTPTQPAALGCAAPAPAPASAPAPAPTPTVGQPVAGPSKAARANASAWGRPPGSFVSGGYAALAAAGKMQTPAPIAAKPLSPSEASAENSKAQPSASSTKPLKYSQVVSAWGCGAGASGGPSTDISDGSGGGGSSSSAGAPEAALGSDGDDHEGSSVEQVKRSDKIVSNLGAEAPEFVPFSRMQQPIVGEDAARLGKRAKKGKQRRINQLPLGGELVGDNVVGLGGVPAGGAPVGGFGVSGGVGGVGAPLACMGDNSGLCGGPYHCGEPLTTVVVSGIPLDCTAEEFQKQLESTGLSGCYDFFVMREGQDAGGGSACALINFVDPAFVMLFNWVCQEFHISFTIEPADVQGCEANRMEWARSAGADGFGSDMNSGANPYILHVQDAVPSQWAVNTVNTMLAPQFREQFRKTKMCAFHRKNRCEMGSMCPFAHSQEELQPTPDLAKTKLCYSYFRGRCGDTRCKFAHGSKELRSAWLPYSPGVWYFGPPQSPEADFHQSMGANLMYGYHDVGHAFLGGGPGDMHHPMMFEVATSSTMDEDMSDAASTSIGGFSRSLSGCDQGHFGGEPSLLASRGRRRKNTGDACGRPSAPAGIDGYALRVRGTFMEAMHMKTEDAVDVRRRSWSDGDLPAFRDAMDDIS